MQRLRKRYKAILRERIAATLDAPDEARSIARSVICSLPSAGDQKEYRAGPASGFRADPLQRSGDTTNPGEVLTMPENQCPSCGAPLPAHALERPLPALHAA